MPASLQQRLERFKKKKPVSGKVHDYFLTYQKLRQELLEKGMKKEADELRNLAFRRTVEEPVEPASEQKRLMEELELSELRTSEEELLERRGEKLMDLIVRAEEYCKKPAGREAGEFLLKQLNEAVGELKAKAETASLKDRQKLEKSILSLGKLMYDLRARMPRK